MDKRQTVIVYGDSLVLAGVQTSLSLNPAFEVIAYPSPIPEHELRALHPRAIIFDIQSVQPEFHYALAQDLPGLLLIGLDPDTNQVLVWSGQHFSELSTQGLAHVISLQDSDSKSFGGKEK